MQGRIQQQDDRYFWYAIFLPTLIFFAVIVLASCGRSDSDEDSLPAPPPLSELQARRDLYVSLMPDPYARVDRCDGLTFLGQYDAGTKGKQIDLYKHEYDVGADGVKTYKTGQWHRSTELCHVDSLPPEKNGSRSECSLENILGAFHGMLSRGDNEDILRTIRYARNNDWKFCIGGDDEYIKLPQISFLLNDWEEKITGNSLSLASWTDSLTENPLKGFKGNVAGDYVALKGRAFGYINPVERQMLRELFAASPENPLYRIYYARWTKDQSFDLAQRMLGDPVNFPPDSLPNDDLRTFDWEQAPAGLLYVWAVALMEGV